MAKKKKELKQEVSVPENIEVKLDNNLLNVKGPKSEIQKNFFHPAISITCEKNKITLDSKKKTKRERKMIGTFKAHIKNMFKGVSEGHVYKLKICSGHFPMNVKVSNHEFVINNFLGEKVPRKLALKPGVTVKVEGSEVIVESPTKDLAGQTSAEIEKLTKIIRKDLRIFQDGIYITEKDGKPLK